MHLHETEQAKKVATEFYANYHAAGGFNFPLWDRLLDEAFVQKNAPEGHADKAGYIRLRRGVTGLQDARTRVLDAIAEGNKVAIHWETSFLHAGDVLGVAATGRTIRVQGVSIVEVKDGRIVSAVEISNQLDALTQMKA